MSITGDPVQIPVGPQPAQVWAGAPGGGPVLFANNDLTNNVWLGYSPAVSMAGSNAVQLPALGTVTLDGGRTIYATAAAGTAALQVIPGGSGWSPSPVQIANQIQLLGIPPSVSNLKSYSKLSKDNTSSPYTFQTFASNGRLWGCHLSFALYKDSTATSPTQAYSRVYLGSGPVLTVAECAVSGANSNDSDDCDLTFPGFAVAAGDTLNLDVNNGVGISNGGLRASCVVLASFP